MISKISCLYGLVLFPSFLSVSGFGQTWLGYKQDYLVFLQPCQPDQPIIIITSSSAGPVRKNIPRIQRRFV